MSEVLVCFWGFELIKIPRNEHRSQGIKDLPNENFQGLDERLSLSGDKKEMCRGL